MALEELMGTLKKKVFFKLKKINFLDPPSCILIAASQGPPLALPGTPVGPAWTNRTGNLFQTQGENAENERAGPPRWPALDEEGASDPFSRLLLSAGIDSKCHIRILKGSWQTNKSH